MIPIPGNILPSSAIDTPKVLAATSGNILAPLVLSGLPGAAMVIEAASYPSLQAALDALPSTGGMVRLPPGTFEITEPLSIAASDVLLDKADLVTEMREIKHPYQQGILAQKGIDW